MLFIDNFRTSSSVVIDTTMYVLALSTLTYYLLLYSYRKQIDNNPKISVVEVYSLVKTVSFSVI